jgi:hypothetical protein
MKNIKEPSQEFFGTYFNPDSVIQLSRWVEILSWIVVGVYSLDFILAAGTFALSALRGMWIGMGFTDYANNIILIVERPFRGVVYFAVLQAIGKAMLILMDMEQNTRRTARR